MGNLSRKSRSDEDPEVLERLALLSRPGYARPSFGKVFQIRLDVDQAAWPVWRRIQVPANYSFWDLYAAINNAIGWALEFHPTFKTFDMTTRKLESLTIHELCEARVDHYLSTDNPSCECVLGKWSLRLQLESIFDRDSNTEYPLLLTGAGAWSEEEENSGPQEHRQWLKALSALPDAGPCREDGSPPQIPAFDPRAVVFDDPDDLWIFMFCEAVVLVDSLEDFMDHSLAEIFADDGTATLQIPARYVELLLELRIVDPDLLFVADNKGQLLKCFTLRATAQQLCEITGDLIHKTFTLTDVHTIRRLGRLGWYFKLVRMCIQEAVEDEQDEEDAD